jgi:hypothetical protein
VRRNWSAQASTPSDLGATSTNPTSSAAELDSVHGPRNEHQLSSVGLKQYVVAGGGHANVGPLELAMKKSDRTQTSWRRAMSSGAAPDEQLLTKGEVAQLCRVEIRTVDRWVMAGKINGYRTPSGRLLFLKRDVLILADRAGTRRAC